MSTYMEDISSDELRWNKNFTVHVRLKNYSSQEAGEYKLEIKIEALQINHKDSDAFTVSPDEESLQDRTFFADKTKVPEDLINSKYFIGTAFLYEILEGEEKPVPPNRGKKFRIKNADAAPN